MPGFRPPGTCAQRPGGAERVAMVEIDRTSFMIAFEEGASFDYAERQTSHLDRQTGEVLWVYEHDEDADAVVGIPPEENRALRERIEADPERYLDIPSLDGGDYNLMLRNFLRSNWTDDEARWRRAADAWSGRIGQWKRRVGDRDAIHAFNAFRDRRAGELAEEFLREAGIEPRWR